MDLSGAINVCSPNTPSVVVGPEDVVARDRHAATILRTVNEAVVWLGTVELGATESIIAVRAKVQISPVRCNVIGPADSGDEIRIAI